MSYAAASLPLHADAEVDAMEPAPLTLTSIEAERITGGTWVGSQRQITTRGAAVDSRLVKPGCLFACLPGARVDGHDFAGAAVASGAALILASRQVAVPAPVLVVRDVAAALGRLAAEHRRRLARRARQTWIAICGSNGKTTTKELVAAACGSTSAGVHATRGNLNNHLGVPLTILATPAEARYVVIEIGANHQGEVADLAAIAAPDIGAVTSIGPEHLEGFGGLAGVARGESELFSALPPGATAILGLAGLTTHAEIHGLTLSDLLGIVRRAATGRELVLIDDPALPGQVAGSVAVEGEAGREGLVLRTPYGEARLHLIGAHNLANACLAFHLAVAAGVPPVDALHGLAQVQPVAGRLTPRPCGDHLVLDDSYNANPASMTAGLRTLAAYAGRRLAVLGAMGELGDESADGHRRVGAEAAALGLPVVVVGRAAAAIADGYRQAGGSDCLLVADRERAVAEALRACANGPTTVLVKASRSAGLEVVVRGIIEGLGVH